MDERVPNHSPLARTLDRRRLMALLGGSAAATGAVALVGSAAPAAGAATRVGPNRGAFDSVTRAFYAKYAGQKWAAIRKKLDPAVVFTVPAGFPNPGSYPGPDAVIGYLQQVFAAGYVVTLTDVAGLGNYSLGVHDCQAPGGSHATAALVLRYTAAGLVAEGTFFGLVAA